jgi:glutathione S-transferase
MLKLHHAPSSRSFRIKWLLEELGVPYEQQTHNFYNEDRVAPDYLKINPGATYPAMEDGGLVLTESGAIINHILRTYGNGRFQPTDEASKSQVDQWMFWSEGNLAIYQRYFWDHSTPPPACASDPIAAVGAEGIKQVIKYSYQAEVALRDTGFMVGDDLTGADFMLCFPLYLGNMARFFDTRPKIQAYVKRIAERPAFQLAIADTHECLKTLFTPDARSFRVHEDGVTVWN